MLRSLIRANLAMLVALLIIAALTGCTTVPAPASGSHNAAGGYRDACGELPPLYGDDC